MDKELIAKLAKEAGLGLIDFVPGRFVGVAENDIESLYKFAARLADACACEIEPTEKKAVNWTREQHEAQACADAIRAKFPMEEKP